MDLASEAFAAAAPLGDEAMVQAFLLDRFLPLIVLVPVVGAMALVTTSIVDELQGGRSNRCWRHRSRRWS